MGWNHQIDETMDFWTIPFEENDGQIEMSGRWPSHLDGQLDHFEEKAHLIGASLTSSNHNEMLATVKILGLNSFEFCRTGSSVLIIWKVHAKRLGKIDARRAGVTSWVLWQLLPLHWMRSETLFEKGRAQNQREFAFQVWKWSSKLLTPSKNGWNTLFEHVCGLQNLWLKQTPVDPCPQRGTFHNSPQIPSCWWMSR